MLEEIIMMPFRMLMFFMFFALAVIGIVMFGQWCMVQNEAQFIASSMGKWGGYTEQAAQSLQDFSQRINAHATVQVSSVGPVPWGQAVQAKVSVPFKFRLGNINVGTYTLTGTGQSVSSYLGNYNGVSYFSP